MHCPHCAVNYESGQAACLNCGNLLKSGRRCNDCGGLNSENAFVCSLCAQPLRTDLRKVAIERMERMESAPRVCTGCQTEYSEATVFCRQCGYPVAVKPRYRTSPKVGMTRRLLDLFGRRAA